MTDFFSNLWSVVQVLVTCMGWISLLSFVVLMAIVRFNRVRQDRGANAWKAGVRR